MSELSDSILELIRQGLNTPAIVERTGCSIGYVSAVRQRFGLAKRYSVGNRSRVLYLWINEDKCATAIAKETDLSVDYVVSIILSHERQREQTKRMLKDLERQRKDMVSYGI